MSEEDAVKTFGASDIDPNVQEDDERLKGDAIGDTLYSESWVLKTLVSLTQVKKKRDQILQVALNHTQIARNCQNILSNLTVKRMKQLS